MISTFAAGALLGLAAAWIGMVSLSDPPVAAGDAARSLGRSSGRRRRAIALLVAGLVVASAGVFGMVRWPTQWVVGGGLLAVAVLVMVERHRFRRRSTYFAVALFSVAVVVALVKPEWRITAAAACLGQMYLTSALVKIRSADFRSGVSLRDFMLFASSQRSAGAPDHVLALPAPVLLGCPRTVWAGLAVATIAAEALLGFAVLVPQLRPFGLIPAIALHALFAVLLPLRIVPFSIASMALWVVVLS